MTLVYNLDALRWKDFRSTTEGKGLFPEGVTALCLLLALGFLPVMPHDPRNQQQVLEYYLHSALSYLARLEDSRTKMYSILLAYRNDMRGLTRARRVLETIFSFLRPTAKDRPLALDVRLGVACTKVCPR